MTEESAPQPYVMMRDPEGNMTRVELDRPVTMGRRSTNAVQVLDPTISRDHARIYEENGKFFIEDLGSTHGTFVNHERISKHELAANDRIRLGGALGHTLTFRTGGEFTMLIGTTGKISQSLSGNTDVGTRPPATAGESSAQSLAALLEISKALNSSLRVNDVFEKIMDAAIALTRGERCMMLLGADVDALEVAAHRNLTRDSSLARQYSQSVVREVLTTGKPQILTDVAEDSRFSAQQSIVGLNLRTVMCVPLRLSHFHVMDEADPFETGGAERNGGEPRVVGVLYVDRRSPTRHFSDQDLSLLESFAGHAAIAIDNARLYEEALEKRRMDEDLRVANHIQRSLLLSDFPEAPWFSVHAFNLPSRGVGGDYYEFFVAEDTALAFAVGDVAGKGIPAAMLMATMQAAYLASAKGTTDLSRVCSHLNQFIVERTSPERYATFFCGQLYPDGRLRYINAGHNPSLLYGNGDEPERLMGGGLPIGLFPNRKYQIQERQLQPGDLLICFSDGVTEANNPAGEEFGEARLSAAVVRGRALDTRELSKSILGEVENFSAGAGQNDDITLMVVRYVGGTAGA